MEALIEYDVAAAPLTVTEEQQLAADEAVIERGLRTFYEVGQALADIREDRLYRRSYRTFEQYCQERWGFGRGRASEFIGAARVVENVRDLDHFAPRNMEQTTPLLGLSPEDQRSAWQRAVDTAPNGKVTGAYVAQVAREYREPQGDVSSAPLPFPVFACDRCGDTFDIKVWHCPRCDHHWQMHVEECRNCHEYDRTKTVPVPMAVHYSSASPEWYTPADIIRRVVGMFGTIDLDPCSNSNTAPNVPARHHFTREDNGLSRDWFNYVYMNPPYGDEIGAWTAKLCTEYAERRVGLAIALLPARTDTAWFAPLWDFPICFVRGRLKFGGAENSAPFPSAAVYLGDDPAMFADYFGDLGPIVTRWQALGFGESGRT